MNRIQMIITVALAASTLALTACGEGGPTANDTSQTATPAWVLTTAPAEARSITEAKADAEPGEAVVLRGRIGGRSEPMSTGSPVFTLVDLQLQHCGQNPDDACPTPWDYCCETPDTITANAATVQIVDADGNAIEGSPADQGFAPLDEVIVVGTVAPRPDARVLTVLATGVYRAG